MKKLTLAYFGSPDFSARFLEKLLTDYSINRIIEVKFVITQPDRPVGRKQILTETPVKQVAKKYGILVKELKSSKKQIILQGGINSKQNLNSKSQASNTKQNQNSNDQNGVYPEFISGSQKEMPNQLRYDKRSDEHLNFEHSNLFGISDLGFRILKKVDLALLYAFGQIIPKYLLDLPKYGFWCIHPSLLPKYRGPSPIAYPLILGEKKTGVTIFKMDEKIDHGPIIAQEELKILETDRRPDLEIKLADLAFKIFKKLICRSFSRPLKSATFTPPPHKLQNDQFATYTRLLKKEDGFIPLSILKKGLNNQSLTFNQLPSLIKEYLIKNPNNQAPIIKLVTNPKSQAPNSKQIPNLNDQNSKQKSFENLNLEYLDLFGVYPALREKLKIKNSSKIVFDYFRGLYPWPGVWTQIRPTRSEVAYYKRLKITDLTLLDNKLVIKKVQLEGKKEVEFDQFNKAYKVF